MIYTVRPGDNLWTLAHTFRVHGQLVALYEWNRSVVGQNPALIYPGQRLIVDPTGITVAH